MSQEFESVRGQWLQGVRRDRSLTPAHRLVLIELGEAWSPDPDWRPPMIDVLVFQLGVSRKSVAGALQAADGVWLRRERRCSPTRTGAYWVWEYWPIPLKQDRNLLPNLLNTGGST